MNLFSDQLEKLKRRFKRYQIEVRLKISVCNKGSSAAFHGTGTNISKSGMRVFIPRELEVGDSISLEVALPYSKDPLDIRAIVRNREGFHYGVEFSKISARDQEVLSRNCGVLALLQ